MAPNMEQSKEKSGAFWRPWAGFLLFNAVDENAGEKSQLLFPAGGRGSQWRFPNGAPNRWKNPRLLLPGAGGPRLTMLLVRT